MDKKTIIPLLALTVIISVSITFLFTSDILIFDTSQLEDTIGLEIGISNLNYKINTNCEFLNFMYTTDNLIELQELELYDLVKLYPTESEMFHELVMRYGTTAINNDDQLDYYQYKLRTKIMNEFSINPDLEGYFNLPNTFDTIYELPPKELATLGMLFYYHSKTNNSSETSFAYSNCHIFESTHQQNLETLLRYADTDEERKEFRDTWNANTLSSSNDSLR